MQPEPIRIIISALFQRKIIRSYFIIPTRLGVDKVKPWRLGVK